MNVKEATVASFRRSLHNYKPRQFILIIDGFNKEKAEKLIGKTVEWKSSGKQPKIIRGKITKLHGNAGHLRALFEKGLPGQALGTQVKIID